MDLNQFMRVAAAHVKLMGKGMVSPEERERRILANERSGAARVRRDGGLYPYDSYRQRERYARQRMDEQQRNSHKPGTKQPRHIFGGPAVMRVSEVEDYLASRETASKPFMQVPS